MTATTSTLPALPLASERRQHSVLVTALLAVWAAFGPASPFAGDAAAQSLSFNVIYQGYLEDNGEPATSAIMIKCNRAWSSPSTPVSP